MRCRAPLCFAGLVLFLAACGLPGPETAGDDTGTSAAGSGREGGLLPDNRAETWAEDEATGITATLRASPAAARVGDRIRVELEVEAPEGATLLEPPSALGDLTILDRGELDPREGGPRDGWVWETTAFRTGQVSVGPLSLRWLSPTGDQVTLEVGPLDLSIVSVLEEGQEELADIRGPVSVPSAVPLRILYATVFLLMLAVSSLAWWRLWRWWRAQRLQAGEIRHRDPADVVALRRLEALRRRGPPGAAGLKPFYVEMTDAVREYMERRYACDARERTTEEMAFLVRRLPLGRARADGLLGWLDRCDLVKFARHEPPSEQVRADVEEAIHFVRVTAPQPAAPTHATTDRARSA